VVVAAGTPLCGGFDGTIPLTLAGTATVSNTYKLSPNELTFGTNPCGVGGAGGTPPVAQTVTITNLTAASTTWTASLDTSSAPFFQVSPANGTIGGPGATAQFTVTPIALSSSSGLADTDVKFGIMGILTTVIGTGSNAETFTGPVLESPSGAFPYWSTTEVTVARHRGAPFSLHNAGSTATSFNLTSGSASFVVTPTTGIAVVNTPLAAAVKDNASSSATTQITATLTDPTTPLCGPLPSPLSVIGD
jgi:hypothetical protein